jgi:hypothetical protein
VHGVLLRARSRRGVLVLLTGLAVAAVPACGGPDLGRANYQRTTVSAQPGSGSVPDGPITDPAVAVSALRTVDPCPLVDAGTLGGLGTVGQPDPSGLDKCLNQVTDAGGKTIKFSLRLGDALFGSTDSANGQVGGLPQIEHKQDQSTCFVTAVTSRAPDLGITAQVNYEGGDPCRPGVTALQKVIQRLHATPAKFPQPSGSLIGVDFCAVSDDAVMAQILGNDTKKQIVDLHSCGWTGRGPSANLVYRVSQEPVPEGTAKDIDLGNGVHGLAESKSKTASQCTITWMHRPTGNDQGEVVQFDYENYNADAATDDPCGKATKAVKAIVPKLPKP